MFREYAGLDSIIQAAGRCNREGRKEYGNVYVFKTKKPVNLGFIYSGAKALNETILCCKNEALDSRKVVAKYFECFFGKCNNFDKPEIYDLLVKCACNGEFQFETAAQNFRLIDASDCAEVIVPYRDGADLCKRICDGYLGDSRFFRKLRRYCVSVRKSQLKDALAMGQIADFNGIYVLKDSTLYSEKMGLTIDNKVLNDILMV